MKGGVLGPGGSVAVVIGTTPLRRGTRLYRPNGTPTYHAIQGRAETGGIA
jgi:hypothetical protein